MIVGRDTEALDWPEIHRASVETVAENLGDGVIAPIFWFAVGGPFGMAAFKAINTLDSMIGYRSTKYRDFGWASARIDDLAGLIPARSSWLLIAVSATLCGERGRSALRIGWRDGRNHPSPNSGWGEAAMAGALGVRLGGEATYRGVPSRKPFLGDPGATIDARTVKRSLRVMIVAAGLAVGLAWAVRAAILKGA